MITKEKGFLLAPYLGFLLILLALGLSYMRTSGHNTMITRNDGDAEKAFYIMEAGIQDAIAQLNQNPSWTTGFNNKAFENGSYTVSIQTVSPNKEITSVSSVNNTSAKTSATAVVSVGNDFFPYGMQAGGNVTINSGTGSISGDVAGGSVSITGVTVNGTVTQGSTNQVPVPDWSAWQAAANFVVNGNQTFSSGTYSGVWYVDGNVTLASSVTFNGTIIATGNINFNNESNITVLSGSNNVALIAGGQMLGNSASDMIIDGLVYGTAGITFNSQSNVSCTGALVSPSSITDNSSTNFTLTYDPDLASNVPLYFSDADATGVKILAWK